MANNESFGTNELWRYFQENFDSIKRQWGSGQFRIQWIVSIIGKSVSCEDDNNVHEFDEFFKSHTLPNATLAIARASELIRLRNWINKKWSESITQII